LAYICTVWEHGVNEERRIRVHIHSPSPQIETMGGRMAFRKDRAGLLLAAAFGAAIVLSSCTCKIKEEQQAMINQLRTSDKQLSADTKKAESDKAKILAEVTSRQGEVRRCNEKKAFVQDKMARWPDVWPDWNPNEPAPAPMEEPTPKKR